MCFYFNKMRSLKASKHEVIYVNHRQYKFFEILDELDSKR